MVNFKVSHYLLQLYSCAWMLDTTLVTIKVADELFHWNIFQAYSGKAYNFLIQENCQPARVSIYIQAVKRLEGKHESLYTCL
jgi:hypothetical protein